MTSPDLYGDPGKVSNCSLMCQECQGREESSWEAVMTALVTKEAGVMAVLCGAGLVTNTLAVSLMVASITHLHHTSWYLINRAIADMLFLLTVPVDAGTHLQDSWLYGSVMCQMRSTVAIMAPLLSSVFLVAISSSWYLDACKPNLDAKYRSILLKVVSAVCWFGCIVFTIPTFLQSEVFMEVSRVRFHCVSLPLSEDTILGQVLRLEIIFLVFAIPFVISWVFVSLVHQVHKNQTNVLPQPSTSEAAPSQPGPKLPYRLLITLLVAFTGCQGPYWLVYLVRELLRHVEFSAGAMMMFPVTMCLPALNAAINPLLCIYFLRDLRKDKPKVNKTHQPEMIALFTL
ncbi:bombesin receptor subtype-3-like [Homarus americanus]